MIEQIKKLIELGYGQRQIANEVGITRDKLRIIFKNNQLKTINDVCKPDELRFEKEFNAKYIGKFIYVSGYINNCTNINIQCLKCLFVFKRNASALRQKTNIRCQCCKTINERNDILLKQNKLIYQMISNLMTIEYRQTFNCICAECGTSFKSKTASRKNCSDQCMKRYNNSTKTHARRKQILENGQVERIPLDMLVKRDKGICHICNGQCDYKDYWKQGTTYIAGEKHPSIDHVIPISKGGTHTWDNVKLAHKDCNTFKNNKTDYIMVDERLVLLL